MVYVVYFLKNTALALLLVIDIAMLVRSLFSWIDPMAGGALPTFLATVTEPIIFPVRRLCEKFHWFEGSPLDMPFIITSMLLTILLVVGYSI